jgi:ATP-dependent DNA helicase DinG
MTQKQSNTLSISVSALSQNGILSEKIPGFKMRPVQLEMAQAVEKCIKTRGRLAVEAGTGTGKTMAYLVPALLSGKKAIISTGTKTLQDQLFNKDLPQVVKALDLNLKIALLKGRANYLCLYRMDQTLSQGLLESRHLASQLQKIKRWSKSTTSGDLADGSGLTEDSLLNHRITSSVDNCLGSACPDYDDCFVMNARKQAMEADVLVINHYLFFADLSLKEEGFGELLPVMDVLIFDESHQLTEIARNYLGDRFSSRQLLDLARDLRAEFIANVSDCRELEDMAIEIEKQCADWRLVFGFDNGKRENWKIWKNRSAVVAAVDSMQQTLNQLEEVLEPQRARAPGVETCFQRTKLLKAAIAKLTNNIAENNVMWLETYQKTFSINQTPLEIKNDLEKLMTRHQSLAWVFTSATLSVDNSLDNFLDDFSLNSHENNVNALILDSPFNYPENTLFYLPRFLPEPNQKNATEEVMQQVIPLLEMSQGRAFVLLTSYRALNIAREQLASLPFPLLVQGEKPRGELLEEFREESNAVLIATGSFWEGVDVAGENLSMVIIDRLPFSSPFDPVIQARTDYIKRQGKDPFQDFQIPEAVISLKQGAGRLIRTETDRGVLVVLDPRIISRRYGARFISSLPPFARTRELSNVREFFKQKSDINVTDSDLSTALLDSELES